VINASDLSRLVYCPREVYLCRVLGLEPQDSPQRSRSLVGGAVWRELSMRQPRLLARMRHAEDPGAAVRAELEAVVADVPYIFAERWSCRHAALLAEARAGLLSEAAGLCERLSCMVDELGFEGALGHVTPWKTEYTVRSEALGMCGRIDKVMGDGVPVAVKAGRVSDFGWEGDRVQVCAYGMLLEEGSGAPIRHGFIEYARAGEKRPVMFTEKLRRRVIFARDAVSEILAGAVPDVCPHGQPRKCEGCGLKDACYVV
jgi:CRISPR/Cas system-associated exonuclease Cas4 (RecB family)